MRLICFFFTDTATTEIYTLSLHDALPIYQPRPRPRAAVREVAVPVEEARDDRDRKSTRLNSSHLGISYAVFCLKKKKQKNYGQLTLAAHQSGCRRHQHLDSYSYTQAPTLV